VAAGCGGAASRAANDGNLTSYFSKTAIFWFVRLT